MGTIQSNIALYNVVETVLRQALQENSPRTFKELLANVDISNVAKSGQQLRDVIARFRIKGYAVKKQMREYSDKYKANEQGWMWNADNEAVALPKNKVDKKPSKAVIIKQEAIVERVEDVPAKELELCFDGTTIVIGRNPASGRIRIVIES